MTPVEYIGTKECQVGRGIAKGLVWNGPNDVIPIADDIAEKITTWHPDTYRLSTGGRSEPGAPVEPGKAEGPADQRLVSTYKILSAGEMVPAERAGYMALRKPHDERTRPGASRQGEEGRAPHHPGGGSQGPRACHREACGILDGNYPG